MKHYLDVYRCFVTNSTTMALSFRTSFVMLIFMDIIFYFTIIFSIEFIFNHIENIGIWDRNRLLFFISFMLCLNNLHSMIISHAFWMLPEHIRTGQLDYFLIRPISTIYNVFFYFFRPSSLFSLFVSLGFLIKYGLALELFWYQWLLIVPLLIAAFTLGALIEFIISCSFFWVIEGVGINFLRMQLQQISRFPDFIYITKIRQILTIFVPVLLIGSGPIHFLYDFSQWQLLAQMILAIILLSLVLKFFWYHALQRYESASS